VRGPLEGKIIRGLYAIVDTSLVQPERAEERAGQLLDGGVRILQLRAKGLASGDFLRLACRIKGLTQESGAIFIVNDRADIAVASGADGLHLGQSDIPVEEARRLLGHDKLIGLSTHSLEQARRANERAADYISFGPVFATTTKVNAEPCLGLKALCEARSIIQKPLVAIGGINEENLCGVLGCSVDAVALISHILKSEDPGEKAGEIISLMDKYGQDGCKAR